MKAKELAEQLLKYPDFDVEFSVCTDYPTYDYPWVDFTTFRVDGIEDIGYSSKIINLDVSEVS